MGSGMLSIGVTGIRAAQLGLATTQHNIANSGTPGYSRQYIQQSAGIPTLSGSGYFGSGTSVDTVRRGFDQYLTAQINGAQTNASESTSYLAKLSQIDSMLADADSGLSPALQDFFTGVQQVAANPSLVSARQSMLSASQALVSRFNSLSERLSELYDSVNGEVTGEIEIINNYALQIGAINAEITKAEASTDQPPNDLLDKREQLVGELNKHVRVTTVQDSTGNFNVFVGKGQQLVVGAVVNSLVAMTSSADPERIVVGLKGATGSIQELSEGLVEGGALGGLMRFRRDALDEAANTLGQVATSLALTFNAQHALGQDLGGLTQGVAGFEADYFVISAPKVMPNSTTAATVTASFLAPSGDPVGGNFYTSLSGSDYVLRNDGTNLTLTRNSDGQVWTDTTVAGLNGQITGEGIALGGAAPTAGVDYLIEPTRDIARNIGLNSAIASDTRRIAAAAPSTTTLGAANTGTLSVTQGEVSPGYTLANVPRTFTYALGSDTFNFTFPASGSVTATYENGTTVAFVAGSIPRVNLGSTIKDITYNGITFDVLGTPANGDTFTLATNLNGVADSRNAAKLANLQTQNTTDDATSTYQSAYASLVSNVGSLTRQIKVTGEAQAALLTQNQQAREGVSGVNLDEEAANLIRYQQAYQAAAKSLDIASKLFDVLLSVTS